MSDVQSRDFFRDAGSEPRAPENIAPGAWLLPRFAADDAAALVAAVAQIVESARWRHMSTPGGQRMSVATTNCGEAGWVSDRSGYRYDPLDPLTGRRWPDMPGLFRALAARAAARCGYPEFMPDACLVNRYEPGARLTLHQDRNERDYAAPIVSVSLGLPAVFLFGGTRRSERPRRLPLTSGDVAVWGGAARLAYHGIAPLATGEHQLTGACRINLTFRRAR
jgi:alkylated DNA repair protein (DNA oxidative demethylase)